MIKHTLLSTVITSRKSSEFWNAQTTLTELKQGGYFQTESGKLPSVITQFASSDLTLSALGGCICYLREVHFVPFA